MKYFIDTEFIEGKQKTNIPWLMFKKRSGGLAIGKPTIDLISIGIVAEDGREYYAISKDFNIKEAWNRYDIKKEWYSIDESTQSTRNIKVYWIRDNILKPIWKELYELEYNCSLEGINEIDLTSVPEWSYKEFKRLINKHGKSNKQIAEDIKEFCSDKIMVENTEFIGHGIYRFKDIQFYGYYSDYDWVVFCWLFGKMIDLPKGFPEYCIDLKQTLDEKIKKSWKDVEMSTWGHNGIENITKLPNYPKQTNEHNALSDAKWNFKLYEFLTTI